MSRDPVKIIAVGNEFYGDDGVGFTVLECLSQLPDFTHIPLINGATDALGLIDHFTHTKHVIIVDAAKMGQAPGTVKVFDSQNIKDHLISDQLSVHGFSLADTFILAEMLEANPEKITIVGIEPEIIQFSAGLSQPVRQAVDRVVAAIRDLCQNQFQMETC